MIQSLIILEDHKEIISNKEADNVKHQGQVIWFRSIVNTSQISLYFPLLKRSRVIFFFCLKFWMFSIRIMKMGHERCIKKNLVNAKQLKIYVFLQWCKKVCVARTILFSDFIYICTQFLVLSFLNHKAQDALLCCESFIKIERSYIFAFWQSGKEGHTFTRSTKRSVILFLPWEQGRLHEWFW